MGAYTTRSSLLRTKWQKVTRPGDAFVPVLVIRSQRATGGGRSRCLVLCCTSTSSSIERASANAELLVTPKKPCKLAPEPPPSKPSHRHQKAIIGVAADLVESSLRTVEGVPWSLWVPLGKSPPPMDLLRYRLCLLCPPCPRTQPRPPVAANPQTRIR